MSQTNNPVISPEETTTNSEKVQELVKKNCSQSTLLKVASYVKGSSTYVFIPSMFALFMVVVIQNWNSVMNGDITNMVSDIKPLIDIVGGYDFSTLDLGVASNNFVTVFGQEIIDPADNDNELNKLDCMRMCMRM